jgi:hypothetical protein
MPSMNIGMQRRIGKLPKTGEFESPANEGYFGYSHRGWAGKKPTTQYEGFFGIGSGWYGNDTMAQSDLPVNGFYGATDNEDEELDAYLNGHYLMGGDEVIAEPSADDNAKANLLTNKVSMSEGFVISQSAVMIGAVLVGAYMLSR